MASKKKAVAKKREPVNEIRWAILEEDGKTVHVFGRKATHGDAQSQVHGDEKVIRVRVTECTGRKK